MAGAWTLAGVETRTGGNGTVPMVSLLQVDPAVAEVAEVVAEVAAEERLQKAVVCLRRASTRTRLH